MRIGITTDSIIVRLIIHLREQDTCGFVECFARGLATWKLSVGFHLNLPWVEIPFTKSLGVSFHMLWFSRRWSANVVRMYIAVIVQLQESDNAAAWASWAARLVEYHAIQLRRGEDHLRVRIGQQCSLRFVCREVLGDRLH